ncbi:hypothetical protein CHL76_08420 [Marinococcus halophilus]|uniref:Uncharacterized protein n=1 Tax=Marinococcus halophilus TaxID=1371 RepID=A0A510Y4B4_MARHA|nr:hypothetical protein [Marinococcus halophilus]OZT80122.1 hypothetical protein CHL76_08420 [Marinococcus halophilus]GEK58169.1 hypothetical protein MHA01_10740 [Marinococcus halophilus]
MNKYVLNAALDQQEAVRNMKEHRQNFIEKWRRLFKKEKSKLISIEKLYLPFWCFKYEYSSKQLKSKIEGQVAIETYRHHTAILPDSTTFLDFEEGLPVLPVKGKPVPEAARNEIYWEAFGREKKRKDIKIDIIDTALLYVPYWVGYVSGQEWDIIIADATTGKIDLGLKDAMLEAIMASAAHKEGKKNPQR